MSLSSLIPYLTEVDINALDSEWALEDDEDVDDLHHLDPRRTKPGMDTTKLNGRDHTTTWSQSKKGEQMGLYVTPVPGLTQVLLSLTIINIVQIKCVLTNRTLIMSKYDNQHCK